jgi:hypothetical protein
MELVSGDKQRRRQLLEAARRVTLLGAVLQESLALGSLWRGFVMDDGREFSE